MVDVVLVAVALGRGTELGSDVRLERGKVREQGADVEELEDALAPARREFPDLEIVTHVESGPTATTLLRRAGDHDTVVVGSRGLGAVGRMFLGSVSHAMVTNARCPTIVVPPTHR